MYVEFMLCTAMWAHSFQSFYTQFQNKGIDYMKTNSSKIKSALKWWAGEKLWF